MKINIFILKYIFFSSVLLLTSCSILINNDKVNTLTTNYCVPNVSYETIPIQKISPLDNIRINTVFSYHDFILIKYLNLAKPIIQYMDSANNDAFRLASRQMMTEKYMLFEAELNAIAAELDCNGERIDKLASYVDDLNSKTQTRMTVASILLGAVTIVTSATVKNDNLNNGINIVGGAGTALLGFMTLSPKGKKVNMQLQRNMLQSIWYKNNDAQIYPSSIWGLLSEKKFSNSENLSLIETTRQRWLQYGLDDQQDSTLQKLYFNDGGAFSASELHVLANIHNELQATIRSIEQDLRSLIYAINALN